MTSMNRGGSRVRWLVAIAVVFIGLVLSASFFDEIRTVFFGVVGPLLIVIGLVMVGVAKE